VILNINFGKYVPKHVVDNKLVDKPWNQWTKEERKLAQYDYTTRDGKSTRARRYP